MKIKTGNKLIRVRYKTFKLVLRPFFYLIVGPYMIDRVGFHLDHDSLIWVWPWKRYMNDGMAWYSQDFRSAFPSRKAEQQAFEMYIKALKEIQHEEKE